MTILLIMVIAIVVLGGGGFLYSRLLARLWGEDASRTTPATQINDGQDYVPTPTPVVFAHHFASIAGAGPIVGPVTAIIYGWGPAVIWVLVGGVLIGGVHDYLATYMATREGGRNIATVARRMLGQEVFLALVILLVVMLALVCGAFMSLSATALTSMLPFERLGLAEGQTLFRVVNGQAVIGGIASTSVIIITVVAPLLGWLYIKKKVPVWICSILAIAVCVISIAAGLWHPVAIPESITIWAAEANSSAAGDGVASAAGWSISGQHVWMLILSVYVLIAAGVPVWIFLQSRDFINVHILYVGMVLLLVTLVVAGFRGASPADLAGANAAAAQSIPMFNIPEGTKALGWFWPGMFIVIACGAVSGFHSLCAGGTTSKQLTSEKATRQIGYYGMLLESFLAVCVIAVLMIGSSHRLYLKDVHPSLLKDLAPELFKPGVKGNPIVGFAMAVGNAGHLAFGIPVAVGAVGGMVLLEGFVVTTLDTAIRLTRYLIEEIWRTFFGKYDVFAEPVAAKEGRVEMATGDESPAGADGIPYAPDPHEEEPPPAAPVATSGPWRWFLLVLRQYWVNSGIAVALTLWLGWGGGYKVIWQIFGASNQMLAAIVLALGSLWLLRQRKRVFYTFIPAVLMLATTWFSLGAQLLGFVNVIRKTAGPAPAGTWPLLVADVAIIGITVYLAIVGVRAAIRYLQRPEPAAASA